MQRELPDCTICGANVGKEDRDDTYYYSNAGWDSHICLPVYIMKIKMQYCCV
ncbi:MAG: hypothetical protein FWG63_01910 [Defluviitaleaceae bacterium]|nr:hypothetical protein [Defluviitaleaceae bacterium]